MTLSPETGLEPRSTSTDVLRMTRRRFLKLTLIAGTVLVTGCGGDEEPSPLPPRQMPGGDDISEVYAAVQPVPGAPFDPARLRFFTPHEAATVEAVTERILPGAPGDPGAREAGVTTYIDNMLAYQEGYTQPAYLQGPQVRIYEGDAPPADADASDVIWVAADEIERYGYQSPLAPTEVYRTGLQALDAYTQQQYGGDFVELSEAEQEAVVEALVEGEAEGFEPFGAHQFFQVLRRGTMEGMFSDPVYGGNRDKIGWRLVGFPGAQRAYLPWEVQVEGGLEREPWGLQDLPPFNYSRPRSPWPASPARRLDQRYGHQSELYGEDH
ncbi:MAG: gluconate 2-dehydrogenase subunit 3 family protein [Anaerolineales bacterium]